MEIDKIKLGYHEMLVLSALVEKGLRFISIRKVIVKEADADIAFLTLFFTLRKLKKKGFVKSYTKDNKIKKYYYYKTTRIGQNYLLQTTKYMDKIDKILSLWLIWFIKYSVRH